MTPDRYFEMQEQMGLEIIEEDIPPSLEDMPAIVINAMDTFNWLGDRVYPEIGYVGKDYTNLELLYKFFYIEEKDKDFIFEIVLYLEGVEIEKSQRRLKAEYDKIKRN